jgi:hypothetical protein
MKTLLGAGALVLTMAAGAWSSDALPLGDEPAREGHGEQDQRGDRGAGREQAPGQATKAERASKEHPHGAPPGQAQRDRGEPPPWAGGPDERSEEPPGLAKQPADHPSKTRGRS